MLSGSVFHTAYQNDCNPWEVVVTLARFTFMVPLRLYAVVCSLEQFHKESCT